MEEVTTGIINELISGVNTFKRRKMGMNCNMFHVISHLAFSITTVSLGFGYRLLDSR